VNKSFFTRDGNISRTIQYDVLPFEPFLVFQLKIYVHYEEVWNPLAVLVDQTVEILGRPVLSSLVLGTGSI